MLIDVSLGQESKALTPMLMTDVGIKTRMTELHPLKALSGIESVVFVVVMADLSQQLLQEE